MTKENAPIGVLLMAYGGPDTLDDVEPYLLDVRGGRPTPERLVKEIRHRYEQIGGHTPLTEITRQVACSLEEKLNAGTDTPYRTYTGMRHWRPYIRQAVKQMAEDGIERLVTLCMAPHYSTMSIGAYYKRLSEAQNELGIRFDLAPVSQWYDHDGLLEAQSRRIQAAISRFPTDEQQNVLVIFSAHSLPVRILQQGDPYDQQLNASARSLAERLGLQKTRWQFCYQSAAATGEPWLGPPIEDVIAKAAIRGEKNLVVAPIGFVADHVEVLFDIDIECRQIAEDHGARLERMESLNAGSDFVDVLAHTVRTRAEERWLK